MGEIKNFIERILGEKIKQPNEWNKLFLLGVRGRGKNRYIVNFILNVARYAVWCSRNVMKEKKSNINMWVFFRRKLEGHIQILYEYFSMKGQTEMFYKIIAGNDTRVLECFKEYKINISC